jgi:probable cell-surface antigen I/II
MKSGGAAGVVLGLAAVGLAMGTTQVRADEKVVDANQPKVQETGVEVKESTIKNETPTGNASTNLNAPAGAISEKQKADLGNENKVTGETPVTIDHTKVQEEAKNAEQVGVNVVQDKTQVAPTTSTAEDTAKAVKSITAKETEKSNELKSTATAHSTAVSNWVDQKNSTVAFNNELDKAHLKAVESYNDFIKTLDADTAAVVAQHKDAIIKVTEIIQKASDGTTVGGYQAYIRSLAEQQGINKEAIKDYLVKKAEYNSKSTANSETVVRNLSNSTRIDAENKAKSQSVDAENTRRSTSAQKVVEENTAKSNSTVAENNRLSTSAKTENERRSNSAKEVENDNNAKSLSVKAENEKRSNSAKAENERRSNSAKDVENDNVVRSNSVIKENERRSNSAKAENEKRSNAAKNVENDNVAKSNSVVEENKKRSQSADAETARRSQSAVEETAKRSNSAKAENERLQRSAAAVRTENQKLSETVNRENNEAAEYNRRLMRGRKLVYTGDMVKDTATVNAYNEQIKREKSNLEGSKITNRISGNSSTNFFSGSEPSDAKTGVDWANSLRTSIKGVTTDKDATGVSIGWSSNTSIEMISGGDLREYEEEVRRGNAVDDTYQVRPPHALFFTGSANNQNGLYSKTMTYRIKNVGTTSDDESVDAVVTATIYMSREQKEKQNQYLALGTNHGNANNYNYYGGSALKTNYKFVYSGTNDAFKGSYSGLIADVDYGQTSSLTVDGKVTYYNPKGSKLTYNSELNGFTSEYFAADNLGSAPQGVYLFTASGSTLEYLHGSGLDVTKAVISGSSFEHEAIKKQIEFALFGEALNLPSNIVSPISLKPMKHYEPEPVGPESVDYTPATYEKATYTPVTYTPDTPPKYEPVSYEKVTYTPEDTNWKPVDYEKVTFTPRNTEWEPVGYDKENFTPADTSWNPVGYTPLKFTPKNTDWKPVSYVPTPYVPEKLPEVPKEPVLEMVKLTAPADPVFHKIPKEPKVPTVHYHLTALNENTPVEKLAQNEDGVNINNESVAKNSTNHFILKPKALPAGRPITTSIVLSDYMADGIELDIAGMQKVNKSWDISYNTKTRLLEVKGVSSEYDKANADRTVPYTPTAFTIIYKVLNDGATYENVFKMDVNGGAKGGNHTGYTSYSNKVRIHTPGSPTNPNDPKNPNGGGNHKIQPVKNNTNKEGQNINNKTLLQTDVNYYVAEWDLDQYINDKSSKSAISKGFGYLENYPEHAVAPITKDYYAVTSKGEKVEGLDFYEADSAKLNELPEFVQQFIKDSGIDVSKFGKFQVWIAKDSQAFYDKYVKTGQDIFFHLPMAVNKGFTGKYENQTYQIDFGNGYYGNVVRNNVPNLTPKKDIVVDGKSANGGTISYGQEFSYLLSGAKLPSNRGSHVWEYRYIDDYDQTGDKYLGKYKVIATTDITVSQLEEVKEDTTFKEDVTLEDGTVVKAGQKVVKGSKVRRTHVIKTGEDVTKFTESVHDEANGIITISFKEDFLKSVVDSSEFGSDASIDMKRIAYGEFYNKYTNRVNGVDYVSNTVKTTTPKPPTPEQPKQPQLPYTGSSESSASLVGMAILSVLGLAGLARRRNQ